MSGAPVYLRNPSLVWRVVPGLVITQDVRAAPGSGAAELLGLAAQVWVVLDQPSAELEVSEALRDFSDGQQLGSVRDALESLVQSGHLLVGCR